MFNLSFWCQREVRRPSFALTARSPNHGTGIFFRDIYTWTPNNHLKMDVWWFPTISYVKIGNHPIETTIYEWLFGVPGKNNQPIDVCRQIYCCHMDAMKKKCFCHLLRCFQTNKKHVHQIGSFPQEGSGSKNLWDHHLVSFAYACL